MPNKLKLRIHTLNVGQGDCQFIEIYSETKTKIKTIEKIEYLILIDTGKKGKLHLVFNYHQTYFGANTPFRNSVNHPVDALIITHWDSDHFEALYDINHNVTLKKNMNLIFGKINSKTKTFQCKLFYSKLGSKQNITAFFDDEKNPKDLKNALEIFSQDNISIKMYAKDKSVLPFNGNVKLTDDQRNQSSIGLLIEDTKTNFKYYTGGDLTQIQENILASNSNPYKYINSLKVSHHGSKYSSPETFLNNIKPNKGNALAILSHGNLHGHPTKETMDRLAKSGFVMISTNQVKKKDNIPKNVNIYILDSYSHIIQNPDCNSKRVLENRVEGGFKYTDSKGISRSVSSLTISDAKITFDHRLAETDANLLEEFISNLDPSVERFPDEAHTKYTIPQLPIEAPFSSTIEDSVVASHNNVSLAFSGTVFESVPIIGDVLSNRLSAEYDQNIRPPDPERPKEKIYCNPNKILDFIGLSDHKFLKLIMDLIDTVEIIKIGISHDFKNKDYTFFHVEIAIDKELIITDSFKLDGFIITIVNEYNLISNSPILMNNINIYKFINIGNKYISAIINVSKFPISRSELSVKSGLNITDLIRIIPDFNGEQIIDWGNSIGLDKVALKSLVLENDWSNGIAFIGAEIGLSVNIFQDIQLELMFFYHQTSKGVSGKLLKNETLNEEIISLRSILTRIGVLTDEIQFIPSPILDSTISDFGFGAELDSNAYSLHIELYTLYDHNFTLPNDRKLSVRVSKIGLDIQYQNGAFDVEMTLGSVLSTEEEGPEDIDNNNIIINAKYNSDAQNFELAIDIYDFNINDLMQLIDVVIPQEYFQGQIQHLALTIKPFSLVAEILFGFNIKILTTTLTFKVTDFAVDTDNNVSFSGFVIFMGVNTKFTQTFSDATNNQIEIDIAQLKLSEVMDYFFKNPEFSKHFRLDIQSLKITIQKDEFSLKSQIDDLSFGEVVSVKNNKLDLTIAKTTSIEIHTELLQVKAFNNTFSAKGGLSVSNKGVSFYGGTVGEIRNIFGINQLDLNEFFISLNQTYTPPTFAVGFMGKLRYKDFKGSTAIYFSPNVPNEQLLAVNFSEIKLSDIVYSVLELKDEGVRQVIESISIESVVFAKELDQNTPLSTLKDIIISNDPDTVVNDLEFFDHNTYRWIENGNFILENKKKFRVYFFSEEHPGNPYLRSYSLSKYVSLYACTSVNGIVLNGTTFETGFAFSGNLNFLGVSQVVNFSASPKEGLYLYYEMDKSIQLPLDSGTLIKLSRTEDDRKGPVLSLSTYERNRHFYLSAKLVILNGLLNFATRILVQNNRISFLLYHEVMGFKTSLMVDSEYQSFQNANFNVYFKFVSSGFTDITTVIKEEIYRIADNVNHQITDAQKKVESAQQSLQYYTQNIEQTTVKLNIKYRDLSDLKKISYPWYRAYKYIALGVRIASVGTEIAILLAYRLAQIALLEAAVKVLDLVIALLDQAKTLSETVLHKLGDVISSIGQGIDWVIRIEKIEAKLEISASSGYFEINPDIRLMGADHSSLDSFAIGYNGNLYDELVKQIRTKLGLQQVLLSNTHQDPASVVDGIYGSNLRLDTGLYNGTFNRFLQDDQSDLETFNAYRNINLNESVAVLFTELESPDHANLASITNEFDVSLMTDIEENLKNLNTSLKDEAKFADEVKGNTQNALYDLNAELVRNLNDLKASSNDQQELLQIEQLSIEVNLKLEQSSNVITHAKTLRQNNIADNDDLIKKLGAFAKRVNQFDNHDSLKTKFSVEQDHNEQLSQEVSDEIINKYKSLGENNDVSVYYKIMFLTNAGVGLATQGNKDESVETFRTALHYAIENMGENSHEVEVIKGLSIHYWNEAL